MADTIRIGVVGAGGNTRLHHIPKLKKIAGVEVVAVVNRSRASSERVAQEFGIERVHDQWQQLVNDPGVDAVVIGTWPYLHCPVTLAALAAGKHVLTEARLAMNAAEARQMLAASRARPDLVTQVVPGPATFPSDPLVMHLLADGYVGEVQSVDLRVGSGWLNRDAPLHWRMNREYSGLNMMSMGIWYECLSRWFGPAKSIMARTRVAVPYRMDEERGERWKCPTTWKCSQTSQTGPSRACTGARWPGSCPDPRCGSTAVTARCAWRCAGATTRSRAAAAATRR